MPSDQQSDQHSGNQSDQQFDQQIRHISKDIRQNTSAKYLSKNPAD